MFRTLSVTTAPSETKLTTLAQLKSDLGLGEGNDTFYERVIDICSDEISAYLRRGVDEAEGISLGRATLTEVFCDVYGDRQLLLGRRPIGEITSIRENNITTARLIGNTDGAITSGDNTFTSAGGPNDNEFTDSYIGKAITVAGAGASGADLETTIASVTSATEVELTAAAGTTVAGATWTVANPAFASTYVVKKQAGAIWKMTGNAIQTFTNQPITVVYTAGWLLPGETGRNLPKGIEDACIVYARYKIDQLEEGEDFSGPLTATSIEGVGSFQFASREQRRGYGLPYEVRALLDRYFEPAFA